MIHSIGPARARGVLVQFPFQVPRRVYRKPAPGELETYNVNHDLIASNDRLAEILERLGDVCEGALQSALPADSNVLANYLTAALENCARIKVLLEERDDSF